MLRVCGDVLVVRCVVADGELREDAGDDRRERLAHLRGGRPRDDWVVDDEFVHQVESAQFEELGVGENGVDFFEGLELSECRAEREAIG